MNRKAIKERVEKATSEPWKGERFDVMSPSTALRIACMAYSEDADFIAHARQDVPDLLDAFEEALEFLEESYAGRPPNGRVFLSAITEHHKKIGAFLDEHRDKS